MKKTMDLVTLKEYAKSLGIGAVGYMAVERLSQYPVYQEEKRSRYLCGDLSLGYEEKDSGLMPELVLNGAQGFVVALFPSQTQEIKASDTNSVYLSDASNFYDYHKVLKASLDQLADFMQLEWDGNTHVLVDTHSFPERFIAKEAGLGCIGRNSYLLNETFGTATYIGLILTDLLSESDSITADLCGDCHICVKACPNQALVKGRYVNDNRCISYLTQKKHLNLWDMNHMHQSLYGCDICSRACPYTMAYIKSLSKANQSLEWIALETLLEEGRGFTTEMGLVQTIKIKTILSLTNKSFASTIGKTSAGWIGKKRLQRNALLALQYAEPLYKQACMKLVEDDQREDILKIKAFISGQSQENL